MHWDVDIFGANPRDNSNEITVNFWAHNLDNKGVFWHDSNGLKMMRREINKRELFNIDGPR
jgi:hypothetical protein